MLGYIMNKVEEVQTILNKEIKQTPRQPLKPNMERVSWWPVSFIISPSNLIPHVCILKLNKSTTCGSPARPFIQVIWHFDRQLYTNINFPFLNRCRTWLSYRDRYPYRTIVDSHRAGLHLRVPTLRCLL